MRKTSKALNRIENDYFVLALMEEHEAFKVYFHCKLTNETDEYTYSTDTAAQQQFNNLINS